MIVLSAQDVENLLDVDNTLECQRKCFMSLHQAVIPLRSSIPITPLVLEGEGGGGEGGVSLFMPAACSSHSLGTKIVSVRQNSNPKINASIIMINYTTGQLECVMNANLITSHRTAAGSALATDILAIQNAKKLVIFGTGPQALAHLQFMIHVRPSILEILIVRGSTRVVDEGVKHQFEAVSLQRKLHWAVISEIQQQHLSSPPSVSQQQQFLADADIICACTPSTSPLFNSTTPLPLQPHVHINAVGSYTHTMRELDTAFVEKAATNLIAVDRISECKEEAGDLIGVWESPLLSHKIIELGHLLLQSITTTTESTRQQQRNSTTLFKSVGLAAQDVAMGAMLFQKSIETGIGTKVVC